MISSEFWKGKKVFVTGSTGFKGTWLCEMLKYLGAEVTGYALKPEDANALFYIVKASDNITQYYGDIRDFDYLNKCFSETKPEIVFHLAAQPIVRTSYLEPRYTFDTNVMGTVNILDCCRLTESVKSIINVTTDKVYKNNEWDRGYIETDELNGYDPYSNSKSCSELVTDSYRNSFLTEKSISVSTLRAGNVIGGGDFAVDRIVPDCIRAFVKREKIKLRNPFSIRPFQHVLEPLAAYIMIAEKQFDNASVSGSYNIGPNQDDCITVGKLADIFCEKWGENASWENVSDNNAPHEANFLKLDCSKIKNVFGWKPLLNISDAAELTIEWTKAFLENEDMSQFTQNQLISYLRGMISND